MGKSCFVVAGNVCSATSFFGSWFSVTIEFLLVFVMFPADYEKAFSITWFVCADDDDVGNINWLRSSECIGDGSLLIYSKLLWGEFGINGSGPVFAL